MQQYLAVNAPVRQPEAGTSRLCAYASGAGKWPCASNVVDNCRSGIPKSDFWASAKEGIDQVGCVYTAQGFEFDYVGVIVGPDLVYRPMDGGWVGQRDQSHDRVVRRGVTEAEFTRYVKSTYRVLLTRGLRGCYVYFMDTPTRDFVLSRTEPARSRLTQAAEQRGRYDASDTDD